MTLFTFTVFGQNQSKNSSLTENPTSPVKLGEMIAQALENNDEALFSSLLFSKEDYLEFLKSNVPEGVPEDAINSTLQNINENFESQIIDTYLLKFKLTQKKMEISKIGLKDLTFESIQDSVNKQAYKVSASLDHEEFSEFSFDAVEYKGRFYLLTPVLSISEK